VRLIYATKDFLKRSWTYSMVGTAFGCVHENNDQTINQVTLQKCTLLGLHITT